MLPTGNLSTKLKDSEMEGIDDLLDLDTKPSLNPPLSEHLGPLGPPNIFRVAYQEPTILSPLDGDDAVFDDLVAEINAEDPKRGLNSDFSTFFGNRSAQPVYTDIGQYGIRQGQQSVLTSYQHNNDMSLLQPPVRRPEHMWNPGVEQYFRDDSDQEIRSPVLVENMNLPEQPPPAESSILGNSSANDFQSGFDYTRAQRSMRMPLTAPGQPGNIYGQRMMVPDGQHIRGNMDQRQKSEAMMFAMQRPQQNVGMTQQMMMAQMQQTLSGQQQLKPGQPGPNQLSVQNHAQQQQQQPQQQQQQQYAVGMRGYPFPQNPNLMMKMPGQFAMNPQQIHQQQNGMVPQQLPQGQMPTRNGQKSNIMQGVHHGSNGMGQPNSTTTKSSSANQTPRTSTPDLYASANLPIRSDSEKLPACQQQQPQQQQQIQPRGNPSMMPFMNMGLNPQLIAQIQQKLPSQFQLTPQQIQQIIQSQTQQFQQQGRPQPGGNIPGQNPKMNILPQPRTSALNSQSNQVPTIATAPKQPPPAHTKPSKRDHIPQKNGEVTVNTQTMPANGMQGMNWMGNQHGSFYPQGNNTQMPFTAQPHLPLKTPQIPPALMQQMSQFAVRKIGTLTVAERRAKVDEYLKKRKKRNWNLKVSYDSRKKVADRRLRVKGKFITKSTAMSILNISDEQFKGTEAKVLIQLLSEKFGNAPDSPVKKNRKAKKAASATDAAAMMASQSLPTSL